MPTKKTTTKVKPKVIKKKPVSKKESAKNKAAKKTTNKKTTKKTTKTSKKNKDLVYASNDQSFWTTDGDILNSLVALAESLRVMDAYVYDYHINNGRNDFSVWVNEVLCDSECASDLGKAKTPKKAHAVVVKHLKFYTV